MFKKPTRFVPSTVQDESVPLAGVPRAGVVRVGLVSVLFVKVSEPAKVLNVPVVGRVTPVAPETVKVVAKAPEIVSVLAALFATPVPPLAAGNAVPEYVIASVPDDVIGLPDMLKMLGTEAATLVTVPPVAGAAHEGAPAVVAVRT